jgi:hypothetical protein
MAEAIEYPSDDLNPCAHCPGHQHLTERAWSDPRFWVACDGCGQLVGGDTLEDARTGWNALNDAREVAPEDVLAHDARLVQALLTPSVLTALDQAGALWQASGQAGGVAPFVQWCHQLVSGEEPA